MAGCWVADLAAWLVKSLANLLSSISHFRYLIRRGYELLMQLAKFLSAANWAFLILLSFLYHPYAYPEADYWYPRGSD